MDPEKPRSGRKRTVVVAAVGVIVVVGVVVGVLIARHQPAPTYDDASRQRFVDACSADGGDPVRDTCQCIYDEIVANIAYERFTGVDAQLRAQIAAGQRVTLPDDIDAFRVDCVARVSAK